MVPVKFSVNAMMETYKFPGFSTADIGSKLNGFV